MGTLVVVIVIALMVCGTCVACCLVQRCYGGPRSTERSVPLGLRTLPATRPQRTVDASARRRVDAPPAPYRPVTTGSYVSRHRPPPPAPRRSAAASQPSTGYRLEVAFKDAADGFNACHVCGFENFKRDAFCRLCAAAIVLPKRAQGDIVAGDGKPPSELQSPSTDYVAVRDDQEKALGTDVPGTPVLTKRQVRVRKRREWLRRLDVKGDLFWYREHIADSETTKQPGYTLQFMKTATTAGASVAANSTTAVYLPPPSRPNGPRKPAGLTPEAVKTMLVQETDSHVLQVNDASYTTPGELAVSCQVNAEEPSINWVELLQLGAQDFPTKYAHFVTTTASLIAPRSNEFVTISVSRDGVLDDSMRYLSSIPRQFVRSAMRIRFLDERGIDAGGLQREWFALLSEQLANPASGVLRCVNKTEQTFYLNPSSQHDIGDDHLVYFYGAGRLLGRALLEEQVCGFHLALPLLKIVLGVPVSFGDLEYFDPEAYASLVWIRDHDGVGELGLTFSMTETVVDGGGESGESDSSSNCNVRVVDLVENGRDIDVTDDNKLAYLDLRFRYLLFESVSSQLYCFLKGLYEVIPQELLMLFDPEEFDYLLCGSDEIDVDDWEKHTTITDDLRGHDALQWFWELVREMPNEYRRRLLHFATGSSRVPLTGFGALTSFDGQLSLFALHGVKLEESEYIWSHACFNRLGLPLYESREKLKVVLYGVLDLDLYGFTTE